MNQLTYEIALDKEYISYHEAKEKGWSEFASRESELKRQLKKYKVYEKLLGIPVDKFLDILLQKQIIYGIINDYVEERVVAYIHSDSYFNDEGEEAYDIRLHDYERSDCGYSTESYNKEFFLTYEEANNELQKTNRNS